MVWIIIMLEHNIRFAQCAPVKSSQQITHEDVSVEVRVENVLDEGQISNTLDSETASNHHRSILMFGCW